jgi:hypothetical protein
MAAGQNTGRSWFALVARVAEQGTQVVLVRHHRRTALLLREDAIEGAFGGKRSAHPTRSLLTKTTN